MTDQWVPAPPQPPGPPPPDNLPPANSWSPVTPCAAADSPSIVPSVIITGRPAIIAAMPWTITLNDGGSPANFTIDHYDASGALIEHPIAIDGTNGDVTLTHDPTQPLGAVTKRYVDAEIEAIGGIPEAPIDLNVYGRGNATWRVVPPEAPIDGQLYARSVLAWRPTPIQSDAPNDGNAYARQGGVWTAAVTGGPYLPLTGGTIVGSLTVSQVLTVLGSNSMVLNAVTNGQQRAILAQQNGVTRWQMILADQTPESGSNAGSNFSLNPIGDSGTMLPMALGINRATSQATFGAPITVQGPAGNLPALTISKATSSPAAIMGQTTAGLARWAMSLGNVNAELGGNLGSNFSLTSYDDTGAALATPLSIARATGQATFSALPSFPGGALNYVLATNGAGVLAWAPPGAYTLPPASTTTLGGVKVDGTTIKAASDGTISTVLVPMGDNRIINGDMRIDQRWNGASINQSNYSVDRWEFGATVSALGNCGQNFNAAVGPVGFPYCLGFQSSSAHSSAATEALIIAQSIEADMVSDFAWGTPNAQPVTLSFWANSSLTGTFSGSIRNYPATRAYPFTFSLPTANVWVKFTVTIPGDTAGTWVMSGNGGALSLSFDYGSGSNFRGPAGVWASANYTAATGAVSVVATNGASLYLTGVKLEIGSVATPYNRQSPAKSLADCQRYYQVISPMIIQGYSTAGAGIYFGWPLGIVMRATPTLSLLGPTYSNASGLSLWNISQNMWGAYIYITAAGSGYSTFSAALYAEL
jgi:hypothetical protein